MQAISSRAPGSRARRVKYFAAAALAALAIVPMGLTTANAGTPRVAGGTASELPRFYQDAIGTRVGPCEDARRCEVAAAETTYYLAEADGLPKNLRWEASITGGDDGGALVTSADIVIDMRGLKPRATYTIAHPYGVDRARANGLGRIKIVKTAGCDIEPGQLCRYERVLNSRIMDGLLRWKTAPSGFLGNVNADFGRRVVGSPVGRNLVRFEGPRIGTAQSTRFFVEGQRAGADTVRPDAPSRPNMTNKSDTGRSDDVTTDRTPTFKGRAEDASIVRLMVDGQLRSVRDTATHARYTVRPRHLSLGAHRIKVISIDAAGNRSRASEALRVKIVR